MLPNAVRVAGDIPMLDNYYYHYLDIETLDVLPSTVVLSVGIHTVNILTGRVMGELYFSMNPHLQIARTISTSTVKFWDQQRDSNPDAYYAAFSGRGLLVDALSMIDGYFKVFETVYGDNKPRVVGCGPEFDNVIMTNAYQQHRMRVPWAFSGNRDFRTGVELAMLLYGETPTSRETVRGAIQKIPVEDVTTNKDGVLEYRFVGEYLNPERAVNGQYYKLVLSNEFEHHALHDARAEGRTLQTRLNRVNTARFGEWNSAIMPVPNNNFWIEADNEIYTATNVPDGM